METDPIRQIAIFRVPELQACLTQFRLSKAGLKKDLQTRLANHLRDLITLAQHASATDGVRTREADAGEMSTLRRILTQVLLKAIHTCLCLCAMTRPTERPSHPIQACTLWCDLCAGLKSPMTLLCMQLEWSTECTVV